MSYTGTVVCQFSLPQVGEITPLILKKVHVERATYDSGEIIDLSTVDIDPLSVISVTSPLSLGGLCTYHLDLATEVVTVRNLSGAELADTTPLGPDQSAFFDFVISP
jgi:hypothetical protein